MYLYYFLSADHALDAFRNQELKVSKFDSLNDPFELLGGGSGERKVRDAIRNYKNRMNVKTRLLCCSKSWINPLLWSHYGDRHRGAALEIEVPDDYVVDVVYTPDRIKLTASELIDSVGAGGKDKYGKLFLETKYDGWAYENEARILFDASEVYPKGHLEFFKLTDTVKLKGIILGPLCELSEEDIEKSLPGSTSANVVSSRLAFNKYEVVHNVSKPLVVVTSSR